MIIYSVLFGLLPGLTYIFGKDGYYDFPQIGVGLCFLAIDVGFLAALPMVVWVYPRYLRKLKEAGGEKVVPEERLWYAIVRCPNFIPEDVGSTNNHRRSAALYYL